MEKKTIAREWLIFTSFALFGLLVFPLFFNSTPKDLFKLFFDKSNWIAALVFSLIPYFLVQLIRSIIWSIQIVVGSGGITKSQFDLMTEKVLGRKVPFEELRNLSQPEKDLLIKEMRKVDPNVGTRPPVDNPLNEKPLEVRKHTK